jgi:hypothetical protein
MLGDLNVAKYDRTKNTQFATADFWDEIKEN